MKKLLFIILMIIPLINYAQDYEMMYNHLKQFNSESEIKVQKIVSNDSVQYYMAVWTSPTDTTHSYIEESEEQRNATIKAEVIFKIEAEFKKIYRKEYLHFVARRIIDEKFKSEQERIRREKLLEYWYQFYKYPEFYENKNK